MDIGITDEELANEAKSVHESRQENSLFSHRNYIVIDSNNSFSEIDSRQKGW